MLYWVEANLDTNELICNLNDSCPGCAFLMPEIFADWMDKLVLDQKILVITGPYYPESNRPLFPPPVPTTSDASALLVPAPTPLLNVEIPVTTAEAVYPTPKSMTSTDDSLPSLIDDSSDSNVTSSEDELPLEKGDCYDSVIKGLNEDASQIEALS